MVYLKSVENVITLGKLIGLLFLFCLPLLSILFLKTKRNDLARPVMGTIFLVVLMAILKSIYGVLCSFKSYVHVGESKDSDLKIARHFVITHARKRAG